MKGHAYGILDIINLQTPDGVQKILSIWNPHGKGEWRGSWSDESEEVQKYEKEIKDYLNTLEVDDRYEVGEQDGIFFMLYDDFVTLYNKVFIAVNFPDSWNGVWVKGLWNLSLDNCGGLPSKTSTWEKNP